jgi:hypothetical protein
MTDQDILLYLRNNLRHLYDFEIAIRGVQISSGFGEVSSTVTVQNSRVFSTTLIPSINIRYTNPKKVDKQPQMV